MIDRDGPHDPNAEQAVLGALLIDRDAIAGIADWLKPEAFADLRNERVYRSLLWLWNKRVPGDLVTLTSELDRRGKLDGVGGTAYLATLMTAVPTAAHVGYYADIVRKLAYRRALIEAGKDLVRRAHADEIDADEAVGIVRRTVEPFAEPATEGGTLYGDVMDAHVARVEDRWAGRLIEHVVPTGLRSIDRLIMGGFRGGDLVMIGARPGMGKTAWMLQLAQQAALHTSQLSVIVELEMSREALLNRAIAAEAGIAFDTAYRVPYLQTAEQRDQLEQDREAWRAAADRLALLPVAIETGLTTTDKIRSHCERLIGQGGVGAIFVDHLDYLGDRMRVESVEQRTAELTRRLKRMAQDLGVPVVSLSQLNREVEATKPFIPSLRNFRNSGAIEQDTDFAFLLYRRKYYVDKGLLEPDESLDYERASNRHKVELFLAKNRNGEVRTIPLLWTPASMTFAEEVAA